MTFKSIPVENIALICSNAPLLGRNATQQDERKVANAILNIRINLPTCRLNICIRLRFFRDRSLHV